MNGDDNLSLIAAEGYCDKIIAFNFKGDHSLNNIALTFKSFDKNSKACCNKLIYNNIKHGISNMGKIKKLIQQDEAIKYVKRNHIKI